MQRVLNAKEGNQDMNRTRGSQYKGTPVYRCVWPKDCAIDGGHNSRTSLADGGHDVKYIIKQENQQGLLPVIPPRKN